MSLKSEFASIEGDSSALRTRALVVRTVFDAIFLPLQGMVLLVVLFAAVAATQSAPRRILLVHSFNREFAPFDAFVGNFRTEIARRVTEPVQFIEVSLQPGQSQESMDAGPIIEYVQAMFTGPPPDLVVPIGGPAVTFAQEHRQQLFPNTPMLMAAVDERLMRSSAMTSRDAAVAVANDPIGIIDNILRVLPHTKQVFVVIGTSALERFWRDEMRRDFQHFAGRLTFVWSDDLSSGEVLARAATLPPNSAIFYAVWAVDAKGVPHTEERALSDLHAVANAPIFGLHSTQLGRGIVGGPLMAIDELSRKAAAVAVRLLNGESPGALKTSTQRAGRPMFDWRELHRWQIPESRLPSGSLIQFREPSVWDRYRWTILSAVFVSLLETFLIVGLVVNRRKLRRAETALAELSRTLMKAQDDERAQVAHELHEDLCQRVVALSMQLQDLASEAPRQSADRLLDISKQAADVAFSGQALSRRLHPSKLELLGLGRTVDAFCREIASQRGVEIGVHQQGSVDAVPHAAALALLRVLEEALHNAVDHSGSRSLVVELDGDVDRVKLTVVDDGIEFDASRAMRGSALSLLAMQERLNLVNGGISVKARRGEGTTIRAWVPRIPTTRPKEGESRLRLES